MCTFQKQQNPMEIPSEVHGGLKITKPNRFSNVQGILKPCLTIITINFRTYPTIFPTEKNKILFAISYFDGTIFNWVQPRLENFLKNENEKQKKTQQMFYKFDNFCIYIKSFSGIRIKTKQLKNNFWFWNKLNQQWYIDHDSKHWHIQ